MAAKYSGPSYVPDVLSLYKAGKFGGAGGFREVFILGSVGTASNPDVVPREENQLTEEDQRRLANQGIPSYCVDDLSILKARVSLDKESELVGVEVSEPGRELTQDYVLNKLETVFKNCKRDGVIICYFGHGKKNTGDWCFQDGFITFRDITELYSKHFRGRVLTLITDCSYSGQWVQAYAKFLEEEGVRPCGHSAVEKGILLKVYASCRPLEVAATPCFSVRCAFNDKNTGMLMWAIDGRQYPASPCQHPFGGDSTHLVCNKGIQEPCALLLESTWQDKIDTLLKRFYTVQETVNGQSVWYYVRFQGTEEYLKKFKERTCLAEVMDYVEIMDFGQGESCPNDVLERLNKKYAFIY